MEVPNIFHKANFQHFDLKVENILYDQNNGNMFVIDFAGSRYHFNNLKKNPVADKNYFNPHCSKYMLKEIQNIAEYKEECVIFFHKVFDINKNGFGIQI